MWYDWLYEYDTFESKCRRWNRERKEKTRRFIDHMVISTTIDQTGHPQTQTENYTIYTHTKTARKRERESKFRKQQTRLYQCMAYSIHICICIPIINGAHRSPQNSNDSIHDVGHSAI